MKKELKRVERYQRERGWVKLMRLTTDLHCSADIVTGAREMECDENQNTVEQPGQVCLPSVRQIAHKFQLQAPHLGSADQVTATSQTVSTVYHTTPLEQWNWSVRRMISSSTPLWTRKMILPVQVRSWLSGEQL